jgi:hypothetical protein
MVRFFDRKKIVRRLQRAEKEQAAAHALALEQGGKKAMHKADKVELYLSSLIFYSALLVRCNAFVTIAAAGCGQSAC